VPSGHPSVDEAICTAIAGRRLVAFEFHGCPRIGEPHDYGVIKGVPTLFFYQVGGESRSGKPSGWRRAVIAEISGLRILDRGFAGSRPTASGRHMKWDRLIATVSPRS
jgi:hypothetical protein